MILSDRDLKRIYQQAAPGPASIDLHVGDDLRYWPSWVRRNPRIDQSPLWKPCALQDKGGEPHWVLHPDTRYLAATREHIEIPSAYAGQIAARSSWGRDGLAVICGPAGFIDPGFAGLLVLELSVIGSELVIWPGAAVAQLIVHHLTSPCERPYAGRYQFQDGVTPSRLHLDAEVRA